MITGGIEPPIFGSGIQRVTIAPCDHNINLYILGPNFEAITGSSTLIHSQKMKHFALSIQQNFPRRDSNPGLVGDNHIYFYFSVLFFCRFLTDASVV